MDRIITGADIARRDGCVDYAEWVKKRSREFARRRYIAKAWDGGMTTKQPIQARIDFGRWIGDCECGGAEYVDPEQPFFFCLSCGNSEFDGQARQVIFPENRQEIEQVVLEIEVDQGKGGNAIQKALMARGKKGKNRCWIPTPNENYSHSDPHLGEIGSYDPHLGEMGREGLDGI